MHGKVEDIHEDYQSSRSSQEGLLGAGSVADPRNCTFRSVLTLLSVHSVLALEPSPASSALCPCWTQWSRLQRKMLQGCIT